ncbi:MAG: hypothetical protein AAFQ66_17285 [Pseudomonadota bacterium]
MIRVLLVTCLLAASPAFAGDADNRIKGLSEVKMKVGQSKVIWGWRGECGKRPNGVDRSRTRATKLGVLSNGKWGVFKSRTCGGWTPAVEIIFTARKKGSEIITTQFDQKIKVVVR